MKFGDDIHNGEVCPSCRRGDENERKLELAERYFTAIAMTPNVDPVNLQGLAKEALAEMMKIDDHIRNS